MADGRELYSAYTANHPDMHCNRFPPWDDLSPVERAEWDNRAISWRRLIAARETWPVNIKARITPADLPYMTWITA